MERCDFSSVITIINDHISESKRGNQSDLMYALFDTFATDEINIEETFDEGAVCRWVNGVRKISPKITKYYSENNKKSCLSSDIEQNILPMMYDSDMAVREIYDLVIYDTTISDGVKQKLTAGYPFSNSKEKADFLSAVLCFSMERNFIKREPEKSSLKDYGALSPFVKNLIYGAEVPKPCRYFCDRAGEQSELHFMLSEYGKVFLQGIPGIGKSELAKAYAQSFKKEYTNIIYINYSGSLKNDIIKLDFAEDYNANEPEADRFRRHDRFLRSLKDDSLIIIDNFNTVASDDETLSTVLAYSCRILFTTRSRFDEYNDTYTVEEMPDDELLGLMGSLYSEADNHSEILREIIHTVHNHTFAVELSARLLEVGILAPDQLLEKLRAEKAAMDSEDKISAKKDGKSRKATYYTHIHTLFSLYKLSKAESEVMRNLALAPHNGVNIKLFALWLELKNMNAINDLIESGFVKELPGRMIALHPMIQEITLDEMKPSVVNCSTFLQSIQTICMCHGNDVLYYKQLFEMIDSIVDLIDNDDMKTYLLFLEDVFPYCEKYENHHLMQKVTNILSSLLKDSNIGADKDRALLYDYLAIVADDPLVSIQYEERAISTIKKVHSGNIVLVCNLYTNLSHFYHMSGNIKSALDNMGTALQLAKKFKIENHHDNLVRRRNYATFLVAAGQPLYALAELMNLSEVIEYHYSNQSLDYAMVQEDMGKIFCCLGKKEQASKHFKYAFHLYKIHFQSEPERIEAKKQEMIMYLSMEKLM